MHIKIRSLSWPDPSKYPHHPQNQVQASFHDPWVLQVQILPPLLDTCPGLSLAGWARSGLNSFTSLFPLPGRAFPGTFYMLLYIIQNFTTFHLLRKTLLTNASKRVSFKQTNKQIKPPKNKNKNKKSKQNKTRCPSPLPLSSFIFYIALLSIWHYILYVFYVFAHYPVFTSRLSGPQGRGFISYIQI